MSAPVRLAAVSPPALRPGSARLVGQSGRSTRTLLETSGLPRALRRHDGRDGHEYRRYLLGLLARFGLRVPVPGWMVPTLREAGLAHVTLLHLHADLDAERARPEPRQAECRRLRSETRRTLSQRGVQERILRAMADEARPSTEAHAADALSRLSGGQ